MKRTTTTIPTKALLPFALTPIPLGAIKPTGWLCDQLHVQANGLSGHLDEFWPSVADSRWIGGEHEGWERGPYWLDGIVPLAVQLGDDRLMAKAKHWIDYILEHQHEDGWLGPKDDPHEGLGEVTLDPWPLFILFKVFTQWEEATGDARVVPAMLRCAKSIQALLAEKPLRSWAKVRWADLVISLHWLYERTHEPFLLDLAATAEKQGFSWNSFYQNFVHTERTDPAWLARETDEDCLPLHGVNNAMGTKSGAVWSRQSGNPLDAWASLQAVERLDEFHGQVNGMFSCDEHLAGRSPIQGTETCAVTEYLYSLEQIVSLTGEPRIADKIEQVVYNALPAALDKQMNTRQYDQQANQVLVSKSRRDWISNGSDANLFSLEGNFGCCTANFHQGWPKFVSHLWMTVGQGGGLAAVTYAPNTLTTSIKNTEVTIDTVTEYPFRGEIHMTVKTTEAVAFPLHLRIPAWAEGASVSVNGELPESALPDSFHQIERTWQTGDVVQLRLPMTLRFEHRYNRAVSVLRGPLVFALRIGESFLGVGGEEPYANYEVHPATPWNYALLCNADGETPLIRHQAISSVPFDPAAPPVQISLPAFLLPDWKLCNDSAMVLPDAELSQSTIGTVEPVQLIPYGSTHLRVSEFPACTIASVFNPIPKSSLIHEQATVFRKTTRFVRRSQRHPSAR